MTNPFQECGVSTAQAEAGFKKLSEVMRKIKPLNLRDIAADRMDGLYAEFGPICFLLPEWWRWVWMFITEGESTHD